MEIFAERLKLLRSNLNVTQQEVANHLGINVRNYRKYEAGVVNPTASTLITLAQYFNISVGYLIGLRSDLSVALDLDRKITQWTNLLYEVVSRSPQSESLIRDFHFELLVIGMIQSFPKMEKDEAHTVTQIIDELISREFPSETLSLIHFIMGSLKSWSSSDLQELFENIKTTNEQKAR